MGGYRQIMPMHWADAELLHQATRELEIAKRLDQRHPDVAELTSYRDGLIARAVASGAKEAEIASAAGITCQAVREVIQGSQIREGRSENNRQAG